MRLAFLKFGLIAAALLAPAAGAMAWQLRPEWQGPCREAAVIDVNLGNSPEAFVRAACCQVTGKEPSPALVAYWAARMRGDPRLRRVDVVRTLCMQSGRTRYALSYSDPWVGDQEPPAPLAPCARTGKRDVGAVVMFFFHCPGGVNCGMDWAGTHAYGMQTPSPLLAWRGKPGLYTPSNPGFWARVLTDAARAGLQFILPNAYGPDIQEGGVKTLAQALGQVGDGVKVGLFDDTSAWGQKWFGPYWQAAPDLSQPAYAARKLYESKWKPFFSQVPRPDWYLVDGRPLIYFYNANTLLPLADSAGVLLIMKQMFKNDFGVKPFVVVDKAFFQDPRMPRVADSQFVWDTFSLPGGVSRFTRDGRTFCNAMVKWDSVGRDHPGALPAASDRMVLGPDLLEKVLAGTRDADVLVLATWNDLGEGTGIDRNYDYYSLGRWLAPDTFMNVVRQAQCR